MHIPGQKDEEDKKDEMPGQEPFNELEATREAMPNPCLSGGWDRKSRDTSVIVVIPSRNVRDHHFWISTTASLINNTGYSRGKAF